MNNYIDKISLEIKNHIHKLINDFFGNTSTSTECCICLKDISVRIVLVPCGHINFCNKCIDMLNKKECPLCSGQIEKYIKIYG